MIEVSECCLLRMPSLDTILLAVVFELVGVSKSLHWLELPSHILSIATCLSHLGTDSPLCHPHLPALELAIQSMEGTFYAPTALSRHSSTP